MSVSTIDFGTTSGEDIARRSPSIHRSAFYLPGRNDSVFAWLHQGPVHASLDHGVLICASIGHEQLHSHRSLRYLADRLASNNIPTVRFDWHGTCDSPGSDDDSRRIDCWIANVRDAARWMREQLGCRKISLIGLRVGATLATLAAAKEQIENLVLWSPVSKGRAYVREMKVLSLTSDAPAQPVEGSSNEIEAGGFILNAETASELSRIDLMQSRPDCRGVLVVSRADLHEDDQLCHLWTKLGVNVRQISADGYAEMMAVPHRSLVPHPAIQQITDWLTHEVSSDARTRHAQPCAHRTHSISFSANSYDSEQSKSASPLRESTFWISRHPRLFSIVTEPEVASCDSKPTIVILNAGTAHRVAPSRLNTLLARRLAADGFRCVRMDLCGLGDSVPEDQNHENNSYAFTAFRDIDIALKQVQQRFKADRIVLLGLCSGGYAAFQSAAQIENPALVESLLINPLTFFWKEGMTLNDSPSRHLLSFNYYWQSAFNLKKWGKLLTGKSQIGLKGALKILARRLGLLNDSSSSRSSKAVEVAANSPLAHPVKNDFPGDLKKITGRNRHLSIFFGKADPGFSILNYHERRSAHNLETRGKLSVSFIEDGDHTFSRRHTRNDLIEAIARHLENRYPKNPLD